MCVLSIGKQGQYIWKQRKSRPVYQIPSQYTSSENPVSDAHRPEEEPLPQEASKVMCVADNLGPQINQ